MEGRIHVFFFHFCNNNTDNISFFLQKREISDISFLFSLSNPSTLSRVAFQSSGLKASDDVLVDVFAEYVELRDERVQLARGGAGSRRR